jgi:hypothetical protein
MDSRELPKTTFTFMDNHGTVSNLDVNQTYLNKTNEAIRYYSKQGKNFNAGNATWILKEQAP